MIGKSRAGINIHVHSTFYYVTILFFYNNFLFITIEFVHDIMIICTTFFIHICQQSEVKLPVVFIIFIEGNLTIYALPVYDYFAQIEILTFSWAVCMQTPVLYQRSNGKRWTVCVRSVDREIGFTLIQFVYPKNKKKICKPKEQ